MTPDAALHPESKELAKADGHDAARAVTHVLAWTAAGIVIPCGLIAIMVAIAHRPQWWSALIAATVISLIASIVSLVPLVPGILAGSLWTVYGYLGGSVMRMLTALIGCIVAVWVFRAPAVPTVLMVLPMYFVQMIAEAIVLSRALGRAAIGRR